MIWSPRGVGTWLVGVGCAVAWLVAGGLPVVDASDLLTDDGTVGELFGATFLGVLDTSADIAAAERDVLRADSAREPRSPLDDIRVSLRTALGGAFGDPAVPAGPTSDGTYRAPALSADAGFSWAIVPQFSVGLNINARIADPAASTLAGDIGVTAKPFALDTDTWTAEAAYRRALANLSQVTGRTLHASVQLVLNLLVARSDLAIVENDQRLAELDLQNKQLLLAADQITASVVRDAELALMTARIATRRAELTLAGVQWDLSLMTGIEPAALAVPQIPAAPSTAADLTRSDELDRLVAALTALVESTAARFESPATFPNTAALQRLAVDLAGLEHTRSRLRPYQSDLTITGTFAVPSLTYSLSVGASLTGTQFNDDAIAQVEDDIRWKTTEITRAETALAAQFQTQLAQIAMARVQVEIARDRTAQVFRRVQEDELRVERGEIRPFDLDKTRHSLAQSHQAAVKARVDLANALLSALTLVL